MANTTFTGAVRSENGFQVVSKNTTTGAFTTKLAIDANGSTANPTGVVGATLTSKTQLANGSTIALAKNTHYLSPADGNAITVTLPTAANSTVGDAIIVEYQVAIGNSETQKFGTSGEFFMAKSAVYRTTGATGSAVGLIKSVDVADGSADDFLNLIGLTNAGPGIGSHVVFTFNGSNWRAEARLESSGTGIAANLSVFATS
jgi:archaellum component FlaF (FlaF/FlaG flagellin family)